MKKPNKNFHTLYVLAAGKYDSKSPSKFENLNSLHINDYILLPLFSNTLAVKGADNEVFESVTKSDINFTNNH